LIKISTIKTDPDKEIEVTNLQELNQRLINGDLIIVDEPDEKERNCIEESEGGLCLMIDEQKVKSSLQPAIQSAKNYLSNYGFTDNDIAEILNGNEESYLIPIVQLAINSESGGITLNSNDFINIMLGVQTANAQNWGKIGKCASKAFGIDDIKEFSNWKKLKKKARKSLVRKAAGKLASRYVSGWIGVAIIVGEFAMCMS